MKTLLIILLGIIVSGCAANKQIEVYKGSNGAHFGPDAIGGAINFVTDVDYTNI